MPNMDGLELLRHINQEFRLPVILISSDSQAEVIFKGVQNGAQFFLVKPIVAEDVKNIWQFSEWWKSTINNRVSPISEINRTSQENAGGNIAISSDNILNARTKKYVWTPNLHTQFVEALLVLGYHEAVPKSILEVMNVPGLRREQVASHLQKYRQFMDRILDGSADVYSSHWIDRNCYSSFVSGNPHLMLINHLRSEQRTGKLAAPYRSGGANNYMVTSANHIGTSTTAPYHNNFYSNQAFKMGGQGSNSVFHGYNIYGGQGIVQRDICTGISLDANQFGNTSAVNKQLRIVQRDPNPDISFGANQFLNTSAANEHQLGAGQMTVPNLFNGHNINGGQQLGAGGMTDQKSRFKNEVLSPDNSLVGPNLIQGKDGEDYCGDVIMDAGIADDKDVGVAYEIGDDSDEDDEYSGDSDDDADYNPNEEC